MKLTEEEFKELDYFFYCGCNGSCTLDEKLQKAKDKGWIEKSAVNEFYDYYHNLLQEKYENK